MSNLVFSAFVDGKPVVLSLDQLKELVGTADLERKLATPSTGGSNALAAVIEVANSVARDTNQSVARAYEQIDEARAVLDDAVSDLEKSNVATDAALQSLGDATADVAAVQRQIDRDAGRLDETMLRLLSEAGRTRDILRDAGIIVDPNSGTVRIYAIDQIATRTSKTEITLDAQKALITTKASSNEVDEKIAMAVLQPDQVALLEPLIARLATAELAIDGLNAAISTKAELIELTRLGGRVTTAQEQIDAAQGLIEDRVEQSTFDQAIATIGTAIQRIETNSNQSSFSVTLRQARADLDAQATANAFTIFAADQASQRQITAVAQIQQQLTVTIVDGLSAEARARTVLSVAISDLDARSVQDRRTYVDGQKALSQSIDALSATNGDQAAAIATLQDASVDQAGGIAGIRTTVRQQGRTDDQDANALLTSLLAGDQTNQSARAQLAQIQTEITTTLVADRLSSALARQVLTARLAQAEATAATSTTALSDADRALAEQLTSLKATFGQLAGDVAVSVASIADLSRVTAAADNANAIAISQVAVELHDPDTGLPAATARIIADRNASVERDNAAAHSIEGLDVALGKERARITSISDVVVGPAGATARAVMTLDVNNRVSGTVSTNDGKVATFGVLADQFGVYSPTGVLLFYVDVDGAIAASFKRSAIGYDNLQMGAVQKAAFFSITNDVAIARGATVQVVSVTFVKEDADSILEVQMFANISSPDDLQFSGAIAVDGSVVQPVAVNIVLDNSNSQGRMPITPFAFVTGIAAGQRTVTFTLTNNETDNVALSVLAGSTLKVVELRKGSIGSATGSGAATVTPTAGGGSGGGGGTYNGGGVKTQQQ